MAMIESPEVQTSWGRDLDMLGAHEHPPFVD
jgi:hypothetical protein